MAVKDKKKKELGIDDLDVNVLKKMVGLLNDEELGEEVVTKKRDDEEVLEDFLNTIADLSEEDCDKLPEEVLNFYNAIVNGDADAMKKIVKSAGKGKSEDEDSKEDKKKDKKKDKEEEEVTLDEINDMSEKELKKLIKDKELDTDPDDFEDDEEGLAKAVAKELGLSKKTSKKEDEKSSKKKEEEEVTLDELNDMSMRELKKLIKEKELDTDPDDYDDEEELAKAIAKELGLSGKKKGKEKEEEPEEKEITLAELEDMSKKELLKVIKENKLDVDPDDCDDEEELVTAIAKEMGLGKKKKPDAKENKKTDKKEESADDSGENMFGFKEGSLRAVISEMFLDDGCTLAEAAKKAEKKFDKEGIRAYGAVFSVLKTMIKSGQKVNVTITAKAGKK